ncbi:MAG: hypothetical protein O8C66_03575 [Candidatus Methanoperedens sp.]|nr:hypothetical protein [Candidatus Methanoperedens sp.]MCZ7369566.1 hypothetical protein [Candidatus Methanoperedens sp.]
MMTVRGPYAEANPVLRDMFITFGLEYMVLAKLWVTAIMLFAIHIYQWRHKGRIYWTVNGTLLAIIAGGLIGTYFNIRVLNGAMPSEPGLVIFIYAAIVLIFIELGNLIDGPAS